MSKDLLPVPEFNSEDEEFEFWSTHDTTDYIDWSNARPVTFDRLVATDDADLRLQELLVMREIESIAEREHTSKRHLIVQFLREALQRRSIAP